MPLKFLSTGNNLDNATTAGGKRFGEMPGDRGIVQGFTLIGSVEGLVPGTGSIDVTPSEGTSASGADGSGNLSAQVTWIRGSSDTEWLQVGGGTHQFPDGFWDTLARLVVTPASNQIGYDVQFSSEDVMVFNQDLIDTPSNPTNNPQNWDGDKGDVTLEVDYDNADNEDPDSIAIVRDGEAIANVPWVDGTTHYTFTDNVFSPGTYHYTFIVYKYPNSRSAETSALSITFGGPPSVEIEGALSFDIDLVATIVFLTDPSGLYVLTAGKRFDTLYNRGGSEDTVDVAIPEPTFTTGFIGD